MENRPNGAYVTEGPSSWTILQQGPDGFADLALHGNWHADDSYDPERAQVYARIVREEDGRLVLSWTPCAMEEGRRWSARLRAPAGGLYRVETCLRVRKDDPAMEWPMRGDMIHHLGVGDLWVIAGQSNAAGYGRGPHDDGPEPGVHMLRLNGHWDMASHPLNDPTDTLYAPNREWSNPAHSPFLLFGKRLKAALGYPIGLVPTALGGSHLRSWNPEEQGELYRNMLDIARAAGGKVKGVLWYQGCSDANMPETDEAATYLERFGSLVRRLREDFGDAGLPVLTVQLNRLIGWETSDSLDRCWGLVRDAQKEAAERYPGVYVVPSLDCEVCDNIHNGPSGNRLIGERLAAAALGGAYGLPGYGAFRAPRAESARIRRNEETGGAELAIRFADVAGQLLAHTNEEVFRAEDANGWIGVTEWRVAGPREIVLALSREPSGETFVHGAYETNPAYYVPFDDETRLPMLAFYRLRAVLEDAE
ncbi:sialate O-acetylesterase [Paenibacillaceae bacterium WGS1546]|uniref:sialate O-acetylesterase n=1 Tax=Cohnella sp. WGS1546 TaxID=3366810 RepID=UPI00372D4EE8